MTFPNALSDRLIFVASFNRLPTNNKIYNVHRVHYMVFTKLLIFHSNISMKIFYFEHSIPLKFPRFSIPHEIGNEIFFKMHLPRDVQPGRLGPDVYY